MTAFFYVGSFSLRMNRYVGVVESYENVKASSRRILELINDFRIVSEQADATELQSVDGAIEFANVSFGYEDEPVLKDVSFTSEPGETLGIVGPTGAGKSTLVRLILRFYDPDSGKITLDGNDIRELTLASLRSAVSFVAQEPFLFPGTVHENVAYNVDVDRPAVISACQAAGAHDFVTELPVGYNTAIGERGVRLSGGQRQRLAIARELVRDPPVFIMDEATSHVDNESEAIIQQNLEKFTADRTTLIVAHRLSTVRDADTILVVENGEVVEQGNHQDLLAADGRYAKLWSVQVGQTPPSGSTGSD